MTSEKRVTLWPSALLLLVGSVLFVAGGRHHPVVDQTLGRIGTTDYFLAFVDSIAATPGWVPMHVLILAGPVCWALAIPGVRQALPRQADAVWSAAAAALVLSATLWAAGFVLDGFIAPYYVRAIREAPTAEAGRTLLAVFGANQLTLARLGLVSLVVGGLATAVISCGLVAAAGRVASWRAFVGAAGILVGIWPLVAGLTGEFSPGPFTSDLWRPTALMMAGWHVALGTCLVGRGRVPAAQTVSSPVTQHLL